MPLQISKRKKILILIGIFVVFIFVLGISLVIQSRQVNVGTDKTEYLKSENLRLTIKNNLKEKENICFSSCYPYYLERKDRKWEFYPYGECQRTDLIERCIEPADSKTFEINLSSWVKEGLHRIRLPICINCKIGDEFKESKRFYSNGFTIK